MPHKSAVSMYLAEIGRKGGKVSGKKRVEKMTPEHRREIAQNAAKARWDGKQTGEGMISNNNETWDHNIAVIKKGDVIEEITLTCGGGRPDRSDWVFPMPANEYISSMGNSGYQFCGSYPYQDGSAIVMKRRDKDRVEIQTAVLRPLIKD